MPGYLNLPMCAQSAHGSEWVKRNYNGCILQSGITYYLRGTIIGLNRTYGKPSCKKSVLKKLYFTKLFEKRVIYY